MIDLSSTYGVFITAGSAAAGRGTDAAREWRVAADCECQHLPYVNQGLEDIPCALRETIRNTMILAARQNPTLAERPECGH